MLTIRWKNKENPLVFLEIPETASKEREKVRPKPYPFLLLMNSAISSALTFASLQASRLVTL